MDSDLLIEPWYISKRLLRNVIRSAASHALGLVLDVGCGKKPYQRFFTATEYVGTDIAGMNADVIADCLFLPFRAAAFDTAICTEVIEHTRDPLQCLRELNRVLKPARRALISAPMMWSLHHEPDDYFRFTKYGLSLVLDQSGFETKSIMRVGGVSSLIWQRTIDVLYFVLRRILGRFPNLIKMGLPILVLAPFQVAGYYVSCVLDKIDDKDAIGWFAIAEKL